MQPMGRKPVRFPSKTDCHHPKGYCNWWEVECCTDGSKKSARQQAKRDIAAEIELAARSNRGEI